MKMINFCSSSLHPHVTVSTVSSDGYEVTNLVSDDPLKRQRGFLAYHAIKPPVTITFNFMCTVNICHLILWPQVGSQKSTGFEILANSVKADENDTHQYERVAFGNVERNDIGIIFYRMIYNSNYLKSTENLKGFTRRSLPGTAYPLLNNVVNLQVKIIRTNSSVPALARIEIWGQPSRSCTVKIREHVYNLWKNKSNKTLTVINCNKQSEKQENTVSLEDSNLIIPEEFLDSITCSLMALPMILPCGKVVDQSTLEKHKECEAKWGRGPSDPFTGKLFTEKCQPVLAAALKARIDKFLVDHAEHQELWTVPRTIGKKKPSTVDNAYEVSASTSYEHKDSVDKSLPTSNSCNSVKRQVDVREDMVKRRKLTSTQGETHNKITDGNNYSVSTLEDEDDLSLNCALQSILSGLPRYTTFSNTSSEAKEVCSMCKTDNMLFKLPCNHIICRSCLVFKRQSNQLNCSFCKKSFGTSDPMRYHV